MKTLFEPAAYEEIVRRLDSLHASSPRQWGKMTVSQMFEHTARALEMATGKTPRKQAAVGKMIGWAFRKGFVGPNPFPKNSPTGPNLIIKHEPELEATRERLKALLADFHAMGEAGCDGNVHGFFGKMTGREWGITQYKHLDHHLRQFGA
jgi:DinB superfamily